MECHYELYRPLPFLKITLTFQQTGWVIVAISRHLSLIISNNLADTDIRRDMEYVRSQDVGGGLREEYVLSSTRLVALLNR